MRWFCLALLLIPSAAFAQSGDVFPPVVDGVEYRLKYGLKIVPGVKIAPPWMDGMFQSNETRAECERRLSLIPPGMTVACLVRWVDQVEI